MKKILVAILALALTAALSSCGSAPENNDEETVTTIQESNSEVKDKTEDDVDDSSGLGMTYNGKMGIDLGNGLVMPFGGGMPSVGMGF